MDVAPNSTERAQTRLAAMQKLLVEHMGKCPKCNDAYLTPKDTPYEDENRVERVWKCDCNYTAVCSHLPFSEWRHSDRQRWIGRAAHDAAHELTIRCPSCGRDSIKPEGTPVSGIGTSSHIVLSCITKGCPFKAQKIPRSIFGTAKANARYIVLFLIVLASAYALGVLRKMDFGSIVDASTASPSTTTSGVPSPTTTSSASNSPTTTSSTSSTSATPTATATASHADTAQPEVPKTSPPPRPPPITTVTSSTTTSSSATTSPAVVADPCATLQLDNYDSWPSQCQTKRQEEYRKWVDQELRFLKVPKK